MNLKSGMRLVSVSDDTQVMVVRAPGAELDLRCGGHPMAAAGSADPQALDPAHSSGTLIGKRYVDSAGTIELLCTKAGAGSLSIGDEQLSQKDAKVLPSSD